MAIYHLSAKIIGRQGGKRADKRAASGRVRISASNTVAAAAYRSGQELYDESTGRTYRYARAERVMHDEIIAPADAPEWSRDRASLWNSVEATERRKDSQLAREIEVALPVELDLDQQRQLVRDWAASTFCTAGAVVDVAIHHDKDGRNPHAHLMTSMRSLGPEGWSKQKLRQWEDKSALSEWRTSWADHVNQALERAGREERVDHRSYADQDEHLPEDQRREPSLKVGPWAKGGDRDMANREIIKRNRQLVAIIRRMTEPVKKAARQIFRARPGLDRMNAARDAAAERQAELQRQERQSMFERKPSRSTTEAPKAPATPKRPAPEAPVPSPQPPPLAPEPEMTDEEIAYLKKKGLIGKKGPSR